MANLIKCPNCGENNLADMEFCQYCQSRLQLTGDQSGNKPLTPGQIPTKQSTGELEPVLPQWLRDARESARQSSAEEEARQTLSQPAPSDFSRADLLAGLQSQSEDDEEDVPDWLANITGEKSNPQKDPSESSEVRWVELGDKKDFAQPEPGPEADVPSWLSGMALSTPPPDEKDELTDWLRSADASQSAQQSPQPFSFDESKGESQDWLHSMVSDDETVFNDTANTDDEPFISSDTPDWLRGLESPTTSGDSSAPPAFSDTPDWLKAMDAENAALKSSAQPDTPPIPADTPDWLKADAGDAAVTPGAQPPSDTPDWLKTMQEESSAAPSSGFDMPDWLHVMNDQGKAQDVDSAVFAESGLGESGVAPSPMAGEPDWLKSAAPQSSIFGEPPAGQQETISAPDAFETPDWLKTFQSSDAPETQAAPVTSAAESASPVPPVSRDESQSRADADSLFTEMPDWLSITDDSIAPESVPAPITNADAIAPGDLPSWVQAMRPVDADIPQSTSLLSSDKSLETHGALAGLQGVLPAVPGFAPVRKPKALSIKLQASDEQQQHAGLLGQILSAETEPVPIDSSFVFGTSRGLRWLLTILVFAVLTTALFMPTPVLPLPVGFPVEAVSALNIVNESIPVDGRVLVIFDYEPARVGEIEAIAIPMFDQMIRRYYPRLTFISTNETGLILAERLISSKPLDEFQYQTGSQYLNLGYLPGGQMGIRAFAENPFATVQYAAPQSLNLQDFNPVLAKEFPPVEGVDSLSEFSALFLMTDDAESARAWIEQTTSARGAMPFVVVASTQAAPMLQPYYASGQIGGLVSGLYGGVLFEQNNEGRSNVVRTYWDAYSIGMLLAMALILSGGLLNLALGLRDRLAAREAK